MAGKDVAVKETAGAVATYLNLRKLTIWGGSNEIQRMILSKQVLGLE